MVYNVIVQTITATKLSKIQTNNTAVLKKKKYEDIISDMVLGTDPEVPKLELEIAFNKYQNSDSDKDKKSAQKEIDTLITKNKDLYFYLEKHVMLMDSVHWKDDLSYFSVAADFVKQLKGEYQCSTPSEITLCHMVANAYVRSMRLSKLMWGYMETSQAISALKNGYYSVISKELDRAERQYHTGLNTLRSLRRPNLQVNVKATNAFIAQNQQLNNNHENNKPN